MAKQFPSIDDKHAAFMDTQQMFFVSTAAPDGRVNLSPKGKDAFRVVDANRIIWLNLTGSGNETAAHLQLNPRMTIMFCAFEGAPMILRLYGTARAVHEWDDDWESLYGQFTPHPGARQVYDMAVDLVQTSCGFAVPEYRYEAQRDILDTWAEKRGKDGIRDYWRDRNAVSMDGFETGTARDT